MPDDFKVLYNEILQSSVKETLPEAILERFDVISCLAFDDQKELYLVSGKQDRKKGVLRVTKDVSMEDAAAEAAILSGICHPAIPKVWGHWSGSDRSFLLREYFEGTTLHALVKGQGIADADRLMDIAISLCDILSYIHGQQPPVIHRDVKPENIILSKQGEIKLIDFGIARRYLLGAAKDTRIIGTEPYMAPEQYGSEQTDNRADIYSLGVVMIYLATGKDGRQFLQEAFPYQKLVRIIEKCTKTDRGLRFQSAEQLKRRLLRTKRHTIRKLILCTAAGIATIFVFLTGLLIGQRRGFEQGVDWLMAAPSATISQYTTEELYEPVTFESWYIDMAVRNMLNREQNAPIYLGEILGSTNKLQVFGTHIPHPSLNVTNAKKHMGKDHVEYLSSNGFQTTDRGDVRDLSDVTMLYYLRELELSSQSIYDLSPLAGMKLEKIDVSNNFIGNLMPLKDMVTLRELDICQNPLNNLHPIANLLSLTRLDISQTQVSDLSPLIGLTKIWSLEMHYCDAKDLAPLQNLSRLQVLGMRGIVPKSYDFLSHLQKLIALDASDSGLAEISRLPELAGLETLILSDNPISEVAGLERYQSLTALRLDKTDITDIAGLRELIHLQSIDISGTGVHDISALAELPNLREVDVGYTFVTDLTPLARPESPITVRCAGLSKEVTDATQGMDGIVLMTESY